MDGADCRSYLWVPIVRAPVMFRTGRRTLIMMGVGALIFSVVASLFSSCGPRSVRMDDPEVQRLLKAAQSFNRTAYGFSPIPKQATVLLELQPNDGYDAMLHISSRTSRSIAFRRDGGNYEWIGEQETFEGPKTYTTTDGTYHEAITLTYDTQQISRSAYSLNQLNVEYRGEDKRLAYRTDLTLAVVKPILKEWGYSLPGVTTGRNQE